MALVEAPGDIRFDLGELFFSVTDPGGRIRLANSVFRRISGYRTDELIGRPHNLVRHPDMPRSVFKVFWDRLAAGRPVAAYVKNRAKDGRPYWVAACATPSPTGHLSIRLRPTTELFASVQDLYRVLLEVEAAAEADGCSRCEVVAVSQTRLDDELARAGFRGYDDFMHSMLPGEVANRDELLGLLASSGAGATHSLDPTSSWDRALRACRALSDDVTQIFERVGSYTEAGRSLGAQTGQLSRLAEGVSTTSLNSILAASRLHHHTAAAALGAISSAMKQEGDQTAVLVRELADRTAATTRVLQEMTFHATIAKLETEMAVRYLADERSAADDHVDRDEALRELIQTAATGSTVAATTMERLRALLADGDAATDRLRTAFRRLGFIELNCRMEAIRVAGLPELASLLGQVRDHVADGTDALDGLHRELAQITADAARLDLAAMAGSITGVSAIVGEISVRTATG